MADIPTSRVRAAAPCPNCGYDLRGHPDPARCPECGKEVHVSETRVWATRWIDLRLLDLWSIGVLQTTGGVALVITLIAIRRGHYVALILGLMAGLCVSTATLWFLALAPGVLLWRRRPLMRALGSARFAPLWRWLLLDAALITLVPVLFVLLTKR